MTIAQSMLPEFDHEMSQTRKLLERVPLEKSSWQPHAKSMTLGRLAGHVATLPRLGSVVIGQSELDFNPPGAPPFKSPEYTTTSALIEAFDGNVRAVREALAGASDAHLAGDFTLKSGGQTIFTQPRVAVLRSAMMNHIIHHRAQLVVYLRMHDVPVPGLYGPSADER
ncbi:MAG TPA: DinB family protein [Gemmatimonadaceae bacterium]|nr:DinB family protein [Gemmatimonadaceae bacterium]